MTKLEINLIRFTTHAIINNRLRDAGEALKLLAKLVTSRMGM